MKLTLLKNPFIVMLLIFAGLLIIINQLSQSALSDEPLVLTQADPEIVMFGTRSCRYCVIARAFFEKHNLPYVENDIETSESNRNLFHIMGGRGTPLIIVNGEIIHGFDENLLRAQL